MFRLLVLVVVLTGFVGSAGIRAESWRAAVGKTAITPEGPIWMGGYASRDEPSDGKIHELYAKAMVIQDADGQQLVIVTLDLLGVTPELRSGVGAQAKRLGISPQSLMMNTSHTHSGPELRPDRILRFNIDAAWAAKARQYVQQTSVKIGQLIESTLRQLQPAELRYSYARAGFAMNRRLPTGNGFINSPNPEGPVDHTVPVLQVLSLQGELQGVMFGYNCHATTVGFQQLCGDYPAFAQQYVEDAHPGVVAMFLNGCSGDQNPYPRGTLELAKQHGRALANGVETALITRKVRTIDGPLQVAMEPVTLQFADPPTREVLQTRAETGNKYERIHATALLNQLDEHGTIQTEHSVFPIQVVTFGNDLTLVAICGEVVVDYSLRLKRELNDSSEHAVWVAGYSNHVFGYLPSGRVLSEGGYEGARAMQYTTFPGPFAGDVEERVIGKVHALLEKASEDDSKAE